jgi:diguanylate cyclase (GGDEF)-like protein
MGDQWVSLRTFVRWCKQRSTISDRLSSPCQWLACCPGLGAAPAGCLPDSRKATSVPDGAVALLSAAADRVLSLRQALQAQGIQAEWWDPAAVVAGAWIFSDGGGDCRPDALPDLALVLEPELLTRALQTSAGTPRVVVLVEPEDLSRGAQMMAAGAADVWSRDLPEALLVQRLRDQLQLCRQQRVLVRQARYEAAVAECARLLVGRGPLAGQLQQVVEILQQASGVSRAYVFRNHHNPQRGLCVSQVHEACAAGIEPQITNTQLQDQPFAAEAPNALTTLVADQPFVGLVADLPEPERSMLAEQGIVSLLILPIFSAGSFWGFMGFDDCVQATRWQQEEIALLRIVAETSGLAIERDQAEQDLLRLANSDPLTGLLNRRSVGDQLTELIHRAHANQQLLSVALLDIDWFKRINDTYGHPAGDAVLGRLARLLRDCFRPGDLLGRYGGEEFLVATLHTTPQQLAARLQTLRQRLQAAPIWYEQRTICVTFSAGIASSAEIQGELTMEALITMADQRLYGAKRRGRDCIVVECSVSAA